jgi:hypothetical protein
MLSSVYTNESHCLAGGDIISVCPGDPSLQPGVRKQQYIACPERGQPDEHCVPPDGDEVEHRWSDAVMRHLLTMADLYDRGDTGKVRPVMFYQEFKVNIMLRYIYDESLESKEM